MAGYIDATLTQNNQGHFHEDVPNPERASPEKQETATIHHIPSDQVSFGPIYDNSNHENTYVVLDNSSHENLSTTYPSYVYETPVNNSYPEYFNPWNQVEQAHYWTPPTSYEFQWEQPMPIMGNSRNNEAMKQFMKRNSGGGCVIMPPSQRERVATPTSDYRQRFHPRFPLDRENDILEYPNNLYGETFDLSIDRHPHNVLHTAMSQSTPVYDRCQLEQYTPNVDISYELDKQPPKSHQVVYFHQESNESTNSSTSREAVVDEVLALENEKLGPERVVEETESERNCEVQSSSA